MNTNKEVRFGTDQQRMRLLKESTRKAVAKSSESKYGIKAGETIDETAEDWAQWCEVRGNQIVADFLRKQVTKSQPEQPLAIEPEIVTYEHCNDLKIPRTRFQQYAKDVLPVWAINVLPKFIDKAKPEQTKPFAAPGAWFPIGILDHPMREYLPGKWESANWPSEKAAQPAPAFDIEAAIARCGSYRNIPKDVQAEIRIELAAALRQPDPYLERYLAANYPVAKGDTLTERVIDALETMDIALGVKSYKQYLESKSQ